MKELWFAVQENANDEWGFGSKDFMKACEMLKEQGHGQIAVIENDNFCIQEITFETAEENNFYIDTLAYNF